MSKNNAESVFDFKFYELENLHRDKTFLRQPFGDSWEEYSYGEVGIYARKLASGLKSLGLRENAHIGLISKNCREWVIADLAIMMAGYISVPFFSNLTSKELNNLLEFGDVDLLIVGKVEDWKNQKKGVPKDLPIISFPNYEGFSDVTDGYQWFDFIEKHKPLENCHQPKLNDTWTIIFTSGTTGNPKGVVLTYLALDRTKVIHSQSNPLKVDFKGNNQFISYLPLNHIAERIVIEHTALRYGGQISFVENLESFVKNLQSVKPSVFFGVPRVYTKFQIGILEKLPQKKLDIFLKIPILSSLIKKKLKKGLGLINANAIASGAAPLPETLRTWFRKIGIDIINGYGMTENCAITSQLFEFDRPGSVGKAAAEVEIKIDSNNSEILMKGPFLMKGYYKLPDLTKKTIKDGWLHTGDQGKIDKDGYLYVTGRVKDLFKTTKGKYIEPLVLESYFTDISEFEQVCVVGLGLDQPICLGVLSDIGKEKTKEEIEGFMGEYLEKTNSKLPGYQKISTFVVVKDAWTVENGLTTPTMKIKRNQIDRYYDSNYSNWNNNDAKVVFES
tara:strand:- start:4320 stop:5999 length:1680 start_codon:yes stop_codon:yes gene_type:complete